MAIGQDYIPANDAQFAIWSDTFVATVKNDGPGYGLTAEELTELETLQGDWNSKFDQLQPRRDAAKSWHVFK